MPPEKFHEIFADITNNYRFIPFDREPAAAAVIVPDAANTAGQQDMRPELSHAMPLANGYSGRIALHWVARTPVLFGGDQVHGLTMPQKLHGGENAPYCIPGSAQRGLIRRVLRIATKGKAQPVDDARPALRDPLYQKRRVHDAMGVMHPPEGGWLTFDEAGQGWTIRPCTTRKIGHTDIVLEGLEIQSLRAANAKDLAHLHGLLNKQICDAVFKSHNGILVLTGAMPGQKEHEHVFAPPVDGGGQIAVSAESFLAFRQAYGARLEKKKKALLVPDSNLKHWLGHFLHRAELPGSWRKALATQFDVNWPNRGKTCPEQVRPDNPPGIPIWFYREDASRPLVIGMTQIMRFPALYTVQELQDRTQPDNGIGRDWSEAMLGYVDGNSSLRGRIDFAFAKALGSPQQFPAGDACLKLTQMGPRVGHFPTYLRRSGDGPNPATWEPATYDSATALLAGRKVYPAWNFNLPLREEWIQKAERLPVGAHQGGTDSYVRFLRSGTVFQSRVDVHNLTLAELGALLWVLSLGDGHAFDAFDPQAQHVAPFNRLSPHCHVAGRARSFGFGNLIPAGISLDGIAAHQGDAAPDWQEAIAAFARAVHGAAAEISAAEAIAWLNNQPRLARLRFLSDYRREADLGTHWPPAGTPFIAYRKLRDAMSGQTRDEGVNQNLNATANPEMAGNILDFGSDSG